MTFIQATQLFAKLAACQLSGSKRTLNPRQAQARGDRRRGGEPGGGTGGPALRLHALFATRTGLWHQQSRQEGCRAGAMHALATRGMGLEPQLWAAHCSHAHLGSMQATLGGSLAVARAPARAVGSAATRATPFVAAARSVAPRSSRQQLRAAATAGGDNAPSSACSRAPAVLPCSQAGAASRACICGGASRRLAGAGPAAPPAALAARSLPSPLRLLPLQPPRRRQQPAARSPATAALRSRTRWSRLAATSWWWRRAGGTPSTGSRCGGCARRWFVQQASRVLCSGGLSSA